MSGPGMHVGPVLALQGKMQRSIGVQRLFVRGCLS